MDTTPVHHIEIVNGKAMIRRRYKAKIVAAMIVKAGRSVEETMEQYDLTRAEVHAALAYYFDNQDTIEQSFDDADVYAHEVGISSEELKANMHVRKSKNERKES